MAYMEFQIEVIIFHPVRVIDTEGHPCQFLTKGLRHRQAFFNEF